jgi:hypothetical protein
VDQIFKYLDAAADHRLNVVRLGLISDAGSRIEGRGTPPSARPGQYSLTDRTQIGRHAEALRINLVPQIDISSAVVMGTPGSGSMHCMSEDGEPISINGAPSVVSCPGADSTYKAIADMLQGVFGDAKVTHVHLGHAPKAQVHWKRCAAFLARQKTENMAKSDKLARYMVERLAKEANSREQTIVLEDAHALGEPIENVICIVDGLKAGVLAEDAKHDVIIRPDFARLDSSIVAGNVIDAYASFPSHRLTAGQASRLRGACFEVNTAYLPPELLDYQLFPRFSALSASSWEKRERGQISFLRALSRKVVELHAMGITTGPGFVLPAVRPRVRSSLDALPHDTDIRFSPMRVESVLDGNPLTPWIVAAPKDDGVLCEIDLSDRKVPGAVAVHAGVANSLLRPTSLSLEFSSGDSEFKAADASYNGGVLQASIDPSATTLRLSATARSGDLIAIREIELDGVVPATLKAVDIVAMLGLPQLVSPSKDSAPTASLGLLERENSRHGDKGVVHICDDRFSRSGIVQAMMFDDNSNPNDKNRFITPLLFEIEDGTASAKLVCVGKTITSTGKDGQNHAFVPIAGSPRVEKDRHTMGFIDASLGSNQRGGVTGLQFADHRMVHNAKTDARKWWVTPSEIRSVQLHDTYSRFAAQPWRRLTRGHSYALQMLVEPE